MVRHKFKTVHNWTEFEVNGGHVLAKLSTQWKESSISQASKLFNKKYANMSARPRNGQVKWIDRIAKGSTTDQSTLLLPLNDTGQINHCVMRVDKLEFDFKSSTLVMRS